MKTRLQISARIPAFVAFAILIPSVVFGGWGHRVKLSTHGMSTSLNENMATCLATSGDTLHVVWADKRTKGTAIYYTQSIDTGLNWSNPVAITDTTKDATFPAIAVSGSFVHVAWMDDQILGHRASFYKRSTDGGNTWGPVFILDSNTSFWPGIAVSGALVVVSLNKNPTASNSEVYFRRSINNGATWDAEQQISNADNRSEDPAIAALGNDVHLSWNDKRSGTMLTYYRHSSDAGVTWGPETGLTSINSYTTMVSLNGPNTDVVDGIINGNSFDVGIRQSSDSGRTFGQLKDLFLGIYSYLIRDGLNLHLAYDHLGAGGGAWYSHSSDGGITWDTPIQLDYGGQPFLAVTGCIVHVLYGDSGQVYYNRNPTGNGNCYLPNTTGGILANKLGGSIYTDSAFVGNTICRHDTVMNNGDGDLIVTSLKIGSTDTSVFSINGVAVPLTISGHSKIIFNICGTPNSRGLHIATLAINAHAKDSLTQQTISVPLAVYGMITCLSATPMELFISVAVPVGSDTTLCLEATNCGDIPMVFTVSLNGADKSSYDVSPLISATIPPNGNTIFCIKFRPASVGLATASLDINSPDNSPSIHVPLRGNGLGSSFVRGATGEKVFSLDQIFPNPTTGITKFNYTTPKESEIRITLSDMTGRIVEIITSGRISEGEHSVTFDASNLPSGSYVISLESTNVRLTRELIIAK